MARLKDIEWNLHQQDNSDNTFSTYTGGIAQDDRIVAVLMDIRDELKETKSQIKQINALLNCPKFTSFPSALKAIQRNTAKKRRQA